MDAVHFYFNSQTFGLHGDVVVSVKTLENTNLSSSCPRVERQKKTYENDNFWKRIRMDDAWQWK